MKIILFNLYFTRGLTYINFMDIVKDAPQSGEMFEYYKELISSLKRE